MDSTEFYSYNVAADVPPLDTMAWLDNVPLFLSMDDSNGLNVGMFGCGSFSYETPFDTPIYTQPAPAFIRKRKSSVDELDPFTSPTKRPFVQQLPERETCVPQHLSTSFVQGGWKADGVVPRGFLGPPPSFCLGDVAPRSSSLDEQVVSPKTSNYVSAHHNGMFDAQFADGLGILTPTYSTLTSNRVETIDSMTNPQLLRTSTIQPSPSGLSGSSQSFSSYGLSANKATLKMEGNLDAMADGWSDEEFLAKRRIVQFERRQSGSIIHANFGPVTPETRLPNSICVSCIWWEEKNEAYVTSVDTIHLLESLVGSRFTVEEKNRIRRNLEGFRPLTVSKAKLDSDSFFKTIMAFPNPKPRNIEKDVKVFPWKILSHALKKIIGKYVSRSVIVLQCFQLTPPQSASYTSPVPSAPSMTHQHSTASFLSSIDMQEQSRVVSPMPFDTIQPSSLPSFDQTAFPPSLSPSFKPSSVARSSSAGCVTDQPAHHYQQEWRRRQSSDGQIPQFQIPTNWDLGPFMDNDLSVLSSIPSSSFHPWCGDAFRGQYFTQLDQMVQP